MTKNTWQKLADSSREGTFQLSLPQFCCIHSNQWYVAYKLTGQLGSTGKLWTWPTPLLLLINTQHYSSIPLAVGAYDLEIAHTRFMQSRDWAHACVMQSWDCANSQIVWNIYVSITWCATSSVSTQYRHYTCFHKKLRKTMASSWD